MGKEEAGTGKVSTKKVDTVGDRSDLNRVRENNSTEESVRGYRFPIGDTVKNGLTETRSKYKTYRGVVFIK